MEILAIFATVVSVMGALVSVVATLLAARFAKDSAKALRAKEGELPATNSEEEVREPSTKEEMENSESDDE